MTNSAREGVAINAFAKMVGVDESSIRKAIKSGRIADAVFEDGSLDEVRARVLWYKTTNPRGLAPKNPANRRRAAQDAADVLGKRGINDAKLDKLEIDLELSRHELARVKRESIPYGEARRALAAFMRLHRDMALQFAVRHGPAIAAEVGCDEADLIASLSAAMRKALNEAADNARPFPRVTPIVLASPEEDHTDGAA